MVLDNNANLASSTLSSDVTTGTLTDPFPDVPDEDSTDEDSVVRIDFLVV